MGPLISLAIRIVVNTIALVVAAYIVNAFSPGAIYIADWQSAVLTAVIFGVVNALIKPLVSCLTCLVQVVTLGLFTLVVNALMLMFTDYLAQFLDIGFRVHGFGPAFFGALIISIISTVLTRSLR